ncbi:hypothetical protein PENCOP_c001G08245 [Penicillium coprophilum]|uniref:Diphthamide biosynthesis protein 4 n=1 Tax=Penicillium coprophilum TaxID=36646 RepID=A0A1V6VAJ9_9EURO|nr:hypothetical protein PENCOP_c001G08245 [Penicillium coprophilum]
MGPEGPRPKNLSFTSNEAQQPRFAASLLPQIIVIPWNAHGWTSPLDFEASLLPGAHLRLVARLGGATRKQRNHSDTTNIPWSESQIYHFNMTRTVHAADFYEILSLPFTGSSSTVLSKQQIKIAYHKALLKHHPDKAGAVAAETGLDRSTKSASTSTPNLFAKSDGNSSQLYTIDQITTAYKTLSDPVLSAEYDRSLRLDRLKVAGREKTGDVFHTGLEIVDLEDLACEEAEGGDGDCWYRGCRCGDERGFLVNEEDLEREAEHGEVIIGCRGCSLWLKILFAVEADEG